MNKTISTLHPAATPAHASSGRRLAAALMLVMGLGLVYVTGLASASTLHNAAHDMRHSAAFPCH